MQDDPNKTPASARHKRGCNCKKSSCLKKYCECYQVFSIVISCMPHLLQYYLELRTAIILF